MSKKLKISVAVAIPVAAIVVYYFYVAQSPAIRLITEPVTVGNVVRGVTATGTVNPVITVQVGCYDSGPITAIYADFNTPVKAGQLIAKIDPRQFQVKVDQSVAALALARAQLDKDLADLAYKKLTLERDTKLLKERAVSQDTLDNARSAYDQDVAQVELDRANIQQAQANLAAAQVNLDYTSIISPVDGTVISRNIDVGQTVAASFQTPTLFLIAKDLTQMQVDTNVSESDIGNVKNAQVADFSVDAFPGRVFEGTVSQVRQAPITVQNVVTYDVVVTVENPEFLLKPGMTANVTIVTARRDNVLRVPAQALRFSPKGRRAAASDGTTPAGQPAQARGKSPRKKRVWVDNDGVLKPVSIATGLDDGNYVEVLSGDLKEGDLVVTEQIRPSGAGGAGGGGGGGGGGSSPPSLRFMH
ncbi:MAG: efflux RND transporter periplasmic adaptor subunit [Candidatus Binataceae bacterium]